MKMLVPVLTLLLCLFLSVTSVSAGETNDVETITSVFAEGDIAVATHMSEIFLKRYPRSDYVPEVLFLMASAEDDREKKLELLMRIINDFSTTDWAMKGLLERGEISLLSGRYEDAERDFSLLRGEFVEAKFRNKAISLSAVNALSSGHYKKAEGLFVLLESLDEDKRYNAKLGLADTHYLSGRFDEALTIYKKIDLSSAEDSEIARVMLNRAICIKKLGDAEEAGRLFEKIISLYPGSLAARSAASENIEKIKEFKSPEAEGLFYLQAGVYKTDAGARDYARELASQGLDVLVIEGDVYRVVVGPYYDDIEAQIALKNIMEEHQLETFVLQY